MKNDLNIHQALKIFHIILEKGKKKDDAYIYNGIYAASDFDGYTVELWNEKVRLSIFFHNKYQVDFKTRFDLEEFYQKLGEIERLK